MKLSQKKKKKTKQNKTINLNGVWCTKDEDQRVLVKEEHIKEWFKSYIGKLLMETIQKYWSNLGNPNLGNSMDDENHIFAQQIRMILVKDTWKWKKVVGLNGIPIEV